MFSTSPLVAALATMHGSANMAARLASTVGKQHFTANDTNFHLYAPKSTPVWAL
jgi:hypothetical protein